MNGILINCDMGERDVHDETDLALMRCIDVANIACGGHAGNRDTVRFFCDLARQHGVIVSAHLSYPDRRNFGRAAMDMPAPELRAALNAQFEGVIATTWLKFHGALYNDACRLEPLATTLAGWAAENGITHVITQAASALAIAAAERGLQVVPEIYAERRYTVDARGTLCLVPRDKPFASIADCDEAFEQARRLIREQRVEAVVGEDSAGRPVTETRSLSGKTVCVHSDSAIALELAKRLHKLVHGKSDDPVPDKTFRLLEPGMTRTVAGPVYGRQDLGYSPSGAMDRFSMQTGNLLLGNQPDCECLEIVLLPPKLEFLQDAMIVICGAARQATLVAGGRAQTLHHGRVYAVAKGDVLAFGEIRYGFRTYLCLRRGHDDAVVGRSRKPFAEIARWAPADNRVRVVRGPEYGHLSNPAAFLDAAWRVSPQSNDIGLRLVGPPLSCNLHEIESGAVTDGTIQLTPSGPIVLLRNRPTLGGYPRVFNVISADVDLMAQYAPETAVTFAEVTLNDALDIARRKQEDIAAFAKEQRTR